MATENTPVDGRHARRQRSRVAVIDAVFALVDDGKVPPTVEDVAGRAGVSVSSIFRNFDGLDDLQRQALDVFRERFAHFFLPAVPADAVRSDRIAGHVKARLGLFDAAGPLLHIARQRAIDYQPMADTVGKNRSVLADQTRAHFAVEAQSLSPAEAANLIAVIDSLTSPEAFDVMGAANGRSQRQIGRAWNTALHTLLSGWPGLTNDDVHVVPGTT